MIDGQDVHASYIKPSVHKQPPEADQFFVSRHCVQSSYCLQIVKCDSPTCCLPFRSNYLKLFPSRFLPPPMPIRRNECGPIIPPVKSEDDKFCTLSQLLILGPKTLNFSDFSTVPYDFHCPSAKEKLYERSCNYCSYHGPTAAALKRHLVVHTNKKYLEEPEEIVD